MSKRPPKGLEPDGSLEGVNAELRWSDPENLEPVFVDQAHIARLNDLFYLTFAQVRLPLVHKGSAGERAVKGEIRPVVKLILPKEALQMVAALLQRASMEIERGKP
jgi:hypothetical protein